MKLLLIKKDDEYISIAADEVKLINREVETIPKEIQFQEKTIPVVNIQELLNPNHNKKESIINDIKELLLSGNPEEIEHVTSLITDIIPISSGESDESTNMTETVYSGLKEILESINDFKKTTVNKLDAGLNEIAGDALPETSDQLEAIVTATEKATNTIIDTTEKMQDSHLRINDEMKKIKEMKDQLERGLVGVINVMDSMESIKKDNDTYLMNILEALSFQDITGQRIYKIVEIVSKMDKNIKQIVLDLGIKIKKKNKDIDPDTIKKGEELLALMKGPRDDGINQNDVDDIIAQFL